MYAKSDDQAIKLVRVIRVFYTKTDNKAVKCRFYFKMYVLRMCCLLAF